MMIKGFVPHAFALASFFFPAPSRGEAPIQPTQLSGIYPHLAMFNNESECGTGAVVPWADRLWVITYASHSPKGSSDKLYEITPALEQIIRPESIGGTPANRMIHRESNQLFIGPYAIDAERRVRVIPYTQMFGRPTGNARHLADPAGKIYCASMEEALYEIDTRTLEVTELWADEAKKEGRHSGLPGYHGKGLYSGQGVVVYANNGDRGASAMSHPATPSGVLAEWDGKADQWTIIRRQQFTEVTGPGDITGNSQPATDPIWSIGWDHRSLILMVREPGSWSSYRLPKSSHSYDGAHGWNTEWPRIRDIGEDALLMTMHGAFWKFPKTFTSQNSAGLAPRSNYLKVIGDFTRWQDRLVFGCDDTAKNEFLNKRKAKGELAQPQSQSNLWFADPARLDQLGPVIGRGAVWEQDDVAADTPSEPFLIAGYDHRGLHLSHTTSHAATVTLEIDAAGNGQWKAARAIPLAPDEATWTDLADLGAATWVRLRSDHALVKATAHFSFRNHDRRTPQAAALFAGLASPSNTTATGGLVRARAENKRTLAFAAQAADGSSAGYYELDAALQLRRVDDPQALAYTQQHTAIPVGVLTTAAASVIFTDDAGLRWRLPKGDPAFDHDGPLGPSRVCREVATERDLFNAHGTFYELPAENAGGFAKIRPVATHNRRVHDFCSYRGLFIMSGISVSAHADNPHILRSEDGRAALWAGAIDDIWQLGKPRGHGGPWKDTPVAAHEASDPYLLTAYDRKTLTLSHHSAETVAVTVEIDLTGTGLWREYRIFNVPSGETLIHEFPRAFSAYWLRVKAATATTATAQLVYE